MNKTDAFLHKKSQASVVATFSATAPDQNGGIDAHALMPAKIEAFNRANFDFFAISNKIGARSRIQRPRDPPSTPAHGYTWCV